MTADIKRRDLLVSGAGLVVGTMASASIASPGIAAVSSSTSADRAKLEAIADLYVKALLAHDPSVAPFADDAVFAENDQRLPFGEASWKTFVRFGRYRHYFADPENGEVGLIANPYEIGGGCVFVLRLKVRDGKIVEAEQFVSRDSHGADAYEKLGEPDPVWLEPIPAAQRQSHEALRAVGFMYFEALQRNDGSGIYPFRDDCKRIEHARPTVSQPKEEGYGHADATVNFTTLKAKEQYELGMMAFVTAIRDRRTLVTDVERGAVLASSYYDYDGALRRIHFKGGQDWTLPPYFRTSRSHHANEAFKIINGSFRYIEMTFLEVPFATKHAFSGRPMTVTLDYDTPLPLPQPIAKSGKTELRSLCGQVLDGLVKDCPCDLPLATDVRYTENGVPVALRSGLWQSLDGLRNYGIFLTDAESGQAGWFGTLNERELFAALALRLRVMNGLISEIETVIARPQLPAQHGALADATFTMFTPPLEYDLDPQGFDKPAPVLLQASPADRHALKQAAAVQEAYLSGRGSASTNGLVVRSNGHTVQKPASLYPGVKPRGHRVWLADADQGLVLDVALRDNPGTKAGASAPFAAPWSDLHARLLKVADGKLVRSEGLVRRLPYGQGTGWS